MAVFVFSTELHAGQARASQQLDIDISAALIGDGRTSVTLTVSPQPRTLTKRLKDMKITSAAGIVANVTKKTTGYVARFTPPAVATEVRVTITAQADLGARRLRAKKTFVVMPPPQTRSVLHSGGPLDLRVIPDHLVLGRDPSATLTLRGTKNAPPRLFVNSGAVSAFEATNNGRLQTTYSAPKNQYFPQVAIIAAITATGNIDWVALPLWGSGVFTSRVGSHERVQARVRDRIFGPFRANVRGSVELPIAAVPGATTGEAIVIERPDRVQVFSLDVPPFNRLLGVCPKRSSTMLIFAVDAFGVPQANAPLELSASIGAIGAPRMLAPGLYEAVFTPPADAELGTKATLTARLSDDKISTARCNTRVRGGAAAHIALTMDRPSYVAGSRIPIAVRIRVSDKANRPARFANVALSAHIGEISQVRSLYDGVYAAQWTLPDAFDNRRRALLRASVQDEDTPISAEASLELHAATVAHIHVEPQQATLRADGFSKLVVRARPMDRFGNLAFGAVLTASARGEISPFDDSDTDGVLEAHYVAPVAHTPLEDVIDVRHPDSDSRAAVRMALSASKPMLATTFKAAYQSNLGPLSSPLVLTEIGVRLPVLEQRLQLSFESGFSSRQLNRPAQDGGDTIDVSLWTIPLLVHATCRQPVGTSVELYLGASGGVYLVGSEIRSTYGAPMTGTVLRPAYGGLLGLDIRMGVGRVGLEAHYVLAAHDAFDLSGNVAGLLAAVGYRFEM